MKFSVDKENFVQIISKVQNIINPKSSLPILANILIENSGSNKIRITATDLDIGIVSQINADIQEPGAITVPAKKFFEIIRELPEEQIQINVKKNNTVNIECAGCFFKLPGLPKEEFPQLPDFKNKDSLQLNQKPLLEMLELTAFAVSHDETRYLLNGILFELDEKRMRLIATDGRRLAMASQSLSSEVAKKQSLIIPTKAIQELMRNLSQQEETLLLVVAENQVLFEIGNTSIISRLIEGEFPNYKQVIPTSSPLKASLDRTQFLSALRRASLLSTVDFQAAKLEFFKDKLVISKSTPDLGESREEILMDYQGAEMAIGFNPHYFIEMLKNLQTAQVHLEFSAADKPMLVKETDYLYIVLPMRI